ncbi:hypothetical protein [Palleniella intestinalis]|nr:hypothetical protein [Palleniella intestinalis]
MERKEFVTWDMFFPADKDKGINGVEAINPLCGMLCPQKVHNIL